MRHLLLAAGVLVMVLWFSSGAGCRYHDCMGAKGYFTPGAKHVCFWRSLR